MYLSSCAQLKTTVELTQVHKGMWGGFDSGKLKSKCGDTCQGVTWQKLDNSDVEKQVYWWIASTTV